jgi:hypothetical protein
MMLKRQVIGMLIESIAGRFDVAFRPKVLYSLDWKNEVMIQQMATQ